MLYTIAVVLLILWLLGLVTSYTLGGFIHVLLVVAIVMVLVNLITGRRPLWQSRGGGYSARSELGFGVARCPTSRKPCGHTLLQGQTTMTTKNEQRTKSHSMGYLRAGGRSRRNTAAGVASPAGEQIQGEGNYDAARKYNSAQRKFVADGKVAAAAQAAAPRSDAESRDMMAAEEEGRRRAREEDPALVKSWDHAITPSQQDKTPGKRQR